MFNLKDTAVFMYKAATYITRNGNFNNNFVK